MHYFLQNKKKACTGRGTALYQGSVEQSTNTDHHQGGYCRRRRRARSPRAPIPMSAALVGSGTLTPQLLAYAVPGELAPPNSIWLANAARSAVRVMRAPVPMLVTSRRNCPSVIIVKRMLYGFPSSAASVCLPLPLWSLRFDPSAKTLAAPVRVVEPAPSLKPTHVV